MRKVIKIIAALALCLVARMMPFNWIVGSFGCKFSWSSVVAPVLAQQFGIAWIGCFLLSKKIVSISALLSSLFHRLPLFAAGKLFQRKSIILSVVVPALCMLLFMFHSEGGQAWVYALYWLIPIGLFFVPESEISCALAASFVAHAVGSVIWLYTVNIPASIWIALIPVVACERLLIAGGIVGLNRLCEFGKIVWRYKVGIKATG